MTTHPDILREVARVRRAHAFRDGNGDSHHFDHPSAAVEYWGSWDLREAAAGRATAPARSTEIELAALARETPADGSAVVVHAASLRETYERALGVPVLGLDDVRGREFAQVFLAALDRRFEDPDALGRNVERLTSAMLAARDRLVLAGAWPFGPMSRIARERSPLHVLLRRATALPDLRTIDAIDISRGISIVVDGVRWVVPPVFTRGLEQTK